MKHDPLSYSALAALRLPVYRIRLSVEDWACVYELLNDAQCGINDTARTALHDWARAVTNELPDTPRRMVAFHAPHTWVDLLWYALTSPGAGEMEDIAHSVRKQVLRQDAADRRAVKAQARDSLRRLQESYSTV